MLSSRARRCTAERQLRSTCGACHFPGSDHARGRSGYVTIRRECFFNQPIQHIVTKLAPPVRFDAGTRDQRGL
jgi:hypothetical protein